MYGLEKSQLSILVKLKLESSLIKLKNGRFNYSTTRMVVAKPSNLNTEKRLRDGKAGNAVLGAKFRLQRSEY